MVSKWKMNIITNSSALKNQAVGLLVEKEKGQCCTAMAWICLFQVSTLLFKPRCWFFLVWRDSGVCLSSRVQFSVLSNHVGFTPWLLYSSTPHSPEGFILLETGFEFKMLEFIDCTRTGISILTSAAMLSQQNTSVPHLKRVLEQQGQLGLPVWDVEVGVWVYGGRGSLGDAGLESHQTPIDHLSLLHQALVVELSIGCILRASQVHHKDVPILGRRDLGVFNPDRADGMGAAGEMRRNIVLNAVAEVLPLLSDYWEIERWKHSLSYSVHLEDVPLLSGRDFSVLNPDRTNGNGKAEETRIYFLRCGERVFFLSDSREMKRQKHSPHWHGPSQRWSSLKGILDLNFPSLRI